MRINKDVRELRIKLPPPFRLSSQKVRPNGNFRFEYRVENWFYSFTTHTLRLFKSRPLLCDKIKAYFACTIQRLLTKPLIDLLLLFVFSSVWRHIQVNSRRDHEIRIMIILFDSFFAICEDTCYFPWQPNYGCQSLTVIPLTPSAFVCFFTGFSVFPEGFSSLSPCVYLLLTHKHYGFFFSNTNK